MIPVWRSLFFWNACTRDGVHWNDFVIVWLYLPKFSGVIYERESSQFSCRQQFLRFRCCFPLRGLSLPQAPFMSSRILYKALWEMSLLFLDAAYVQFNTLSLLVVNVFI